MSTTPDYDAIVVGAGPYGLSAAAHLAGRGLGIGVFGRPMALWRDHVPDRMLVRSPWPSTQLSDPRGAFTIDRFARETGASISYPIARATFTEYGLWFEQHAVPRVDTACVSSIDRNLAGFALTLTDGRQVTSTAVVVATGVRHYAYRPVLYARMPPSLVSHSSEHSDFERFRGRQVIVVGGGQSAIECAALLYEAGAAVHVVARRAIGWRTADRVDERAIGRRLVDALPQAFYCLPDRAKDRYNGRYSATAADWLRHRVLGKVALHERHAILAIDAKGDFAVTTIADGTTVRADHVILATGYDVRLDALPILGPSLRRTIRTRNGAPVLSAWFESSVPGLYFLGLAAVPTFGPICRYVAGCGPAARRVARDVARRRVAASRSLVSLSWSTSAS